MSKPLQRTSSGQRFYHSELFLKKSLGESPVPRSLHRSSLGQVRRYPQPEEDELPETLYQDMACSHHVGKKLRVHPFPHKPSPHWERLLIVLNVESVLVEALTLFGIRIHTGEKPHEGGEYGKGLGECSDHGAHQQTHWRGPFSVSKPSIRAPASLPHRGCTLGRGLISALS